MKVKETIKVIKENITYIKGMRLDPTPVIETKTKCPSAWTWICLARFARTENKCKNKGKCKGVELPFLYYIVEFKGFQEPHAALVNFPCKGF